VSIAELVGLFKEELAFDGAIRYDSSKPDGTPRKLLDTGRITALGWRPKIRLREGIQSTYRWFLENQGQIRR
jgi:GDP-L-fucose synthase